MVGAGIASGLLAQVVWWIPLAVVILTLAYLIYAAVYQSK